MDRPQWTGLSNGSTPAAEQSHTLGDFFSIKRGMATGANSFFILERDEAIRKGIPAEFLRPILPSPRHLANAVIEAEADGYPRLMKPLAIIDCDLPEEVIQQGHPDFWRYLEQGKARGIHTGYLASRRIPGTLRRSGQPPHSFAPTWAGRVATGTLSAFSGTSRRRRR
jgi:adenine-specific DNA-methyltransferase